MIFSTSKKLKSIALFVGASFALVFLVACTGGALSPGLTARMDQSGASLNRTEALGLINQYRSSRGAPPLTADSSLDTIAQSLATQYASNSNRPDKPDANIIHMRLSAGYLNFAETFSGWRASSADADAIADPTTTSAGLGVAYSPNSAYGVHWVLLLSGPPTIEPDFTAQ